MNNDNKNSITLKLRLLAFLALSVMFIWYVVLSENRGNIMTVAFLDVGQGDAIFIEAPNGNTVLIDGGPNRSLLRSLGGVLPFYRRSVDLIINTNPDADHYAGFIDLLERYHVGMELEAGTLSKTPTYETFENSLDQHGVEHMNAEKGMKITLDSKYGVYLYILYPDQDPTNLSSNDGSIVAKLVYASTTVMLQGDATEKVEKHLLSIKEDVDADILKVGHHGSRTSTSDEYVKAVSPEYAIISAGFNNRYGHPHAETLDTLNKYNVQIKKTMDRGTIVFKSDGREFTLLP